LNALIEQVRNNPDLAFLAPPDAPLRITAGGKPVTVQIVSAQAYGLGTFMGGLPISPEDAILTGKGGGSYKLYDAVLDNPQAFSCFQQRRRAVVSRPWEVEAGGESEIDKAAADHIRGQLARLDWDGISDRMLYGIWYGFAVGELIYEARDGKWEVADIVVPNRDRFRFDANGELRLTDTAYQSVPLPERKFWTYRAGASHDHAFYGLGLAHWCYWPAWFAKNGLNFWSIYLEKFAMPTAIGKVPGGGGVDDPRFIAEQGKMLQALSSIISQAAIAVPDTFEVELLEATRAGAAEYGKFLDKQDADIAKIILSQTMTTDNGSSRSQSDTHMEVREEVTAGDADLLCSTFNEGPVRWLTEWNFPGAALPRVFRVMEDPADLYALTARDVLLDGLGWSRTEDKFRELYGDGYERKTPAVVPPALAARQDGPAMAFAAPRPLYVSRAVVNAAEIIAWAESQGFTDIVPDLHVTLLYSKRPVDWMKMGENWSGDGKGQVTIQPGGPRLVEPLGAATAVLLFSSTDLQWRHRNMIEAGASSDYPEYQPHITITYGDAPDLATVEPYRGKIVLAPEQFEEIETDDPAFAFAATQHVIDRLIDSASGPANAAMLAMVEPLRARLAGVTQPEAVRLAIIEAFADMDDGPLAEIIAKAGLGLRAAEDGGLDTERLA